MDKNNIGQLFDRIAGTYDRFNHLLSLNIDKSWRRRTVKSLDYAGKLLDVAIGTADLSLEVLRRGKAGSITGLDLSAKMMEIGRAKAEAAGFGGRIEFHQGSALDMPYEGGAFDAVTCAFGVRNFSGLDKGLSEMHRVLSDGGQLAILEFSYPGNRLVRWAYDIFFSRLMPVVGKAVSNDPTAYVYFRESVKNFIWGEEMAARIKAAGFREVSFKTMTFGICTLYLARKQA